MSEGVPYTFRITLYQDVAPQRIVVKDETLSGPDRDLTLPPGAQPPYRLTLDRAQESPNSLTIDLAGGPSPSPPRADEFDPEITRDSNVLTVEAYLGDQAFGTQDDTRYALRFRNNSRYYIAEDVNVSVALAYDPDVPTPPRDGNATLNIIPQTQHLACIDPEEEREVTFMIISRGIEPGLYPLDVSVEYNLIYWDGRRARATWPQLLPVQGGDVCFQFPTNGLEARLPRQPSPPRRNPMSQNTFFAQSRPRHRVLHPILLCISLPGGGQLEVSYRLTKNNHPDPERCACSYGVNPESNSVESYFSTQDTAALEITLHNNSHHDLKHVRLSGVRLVSANDDNTEGSIADRKLPDGNLLFEIVPGDIYFGHLKPSERMVKYLALVTRGTEPGRYFVQMEAHYDIEQCRIPFSLALTVNPD